MRTIEKQHLNYCIDNHLGITKSCQYLKCRPSTYRKWMMFYNLDIDNSYTPNIVCKICGQRQCRKIDICGDCRGNVLRYVIRTFLLEQSGGKCSQCGITDYDLLDFHHIDPKQKELTIFSGTHFGFHNLEKYLKETKKCIILCCNCHKKIHSKKINPQLHSYFQERLEQLRCRQI